MADPTGGAYSAPPDPLAGLNGRKRGRKGIGKGREMEKGGKRKKGEEG